MGKNRESDQATVTSTALPWEASTDDASSEPLHLVLAWSLDQPHRIGECAALADACVLGRGGERSEDPAPRLMFMRKRPGLNERMPWLTGSRISRLQLSFEPSGDDAVMVHRLGRCPLFHNGRSVDRTEIRAGDVLTLKNAAVFFVERRPITMPKLAHYLDDGEFRFGRPDPEGMVGETPVAWSMREQLAFAAAADHHVLLFGESGAGKELAAATLHRLSPRGSRPLVARNAATFPATLVDSELFGSAKNYPNVGSPERTGLIGEADESNLFLDEVGELPSEQQAHLLRVLDRGGEYQRLGESQTRTSHFRLYAATNRDPENLKHDFLARFTVRVSVPCLNERRGDIPLILADILRRARQDAPESAGRFFARDGRTAKLSPNLVEALLAHQYTHHVRELERVVWTSMSTSPGEYLALTDEVRVQLGQDIVEESAGRENQPSEDQIRSALEASGGNRTEAAKMLGLKSRYALYRLMKKQGLVETSP